jgi:phosphoribosylglycinamide formyltransferase 1
LGRVRVAVLVSGTGSILEAMIAADVPVVMVLADRPCRALEIADGARIETALVDRRAFGGFGPAFDRSHYTDVVVGRLEAAAVDLIAMAGFGTVLAPRMFAAFDGRVLNTHPALLPAFPGWHAVADALAAGVAVTGCTVHVATAETDAGPVLAQEEVQVRPDDTVETLHERIKAVERRLYPETVKAFAATLAAGTPPVGTRRVGHEVRR